MLYIISFLPQQVDSLKNRLFDINEETPPAQEKETAATATPDTTSGKKKKKEKKKKESREKTESTSKQEKNPPASQQLTNQQSTSHTFGLKNDSLPSTQQFNNVSVFRGHLLKPDQESDKIHLQNREYWVPSVILFSLLIIVWARNSHSNRFSRIGKAFFNIREFYQVVREEYAMINSLSVAMVTLFILTLSVFIYQINAWYLIFPLTPTPFIFFTKIVTAVVLFLLLKLIAVRLLGIMFFGKAEQVADFVYNIFLMNNISGIALVPIVIFMEYFNTTSKSILIPISYIILISIYLYRILRTFSISSGEGKVSKLYFFAYLCTLEFLPFVVIFKMIMNRL
ncbi:MAG: DUF4271 domain-containing protein [Bacteroidetes bacterium]|nr:DUF4271 domain-containing protein [Bacteroidota bacterium]